MWVKICANTTLEDTQLAIDLGADAVGFVFAPSKRQVTPQQVERIVSGLSADAIHAERIGVFQDAKLKEVVRSVKLGRLTGVQLHSDPNPRLIASLRQELGAGMILIQTLHWSVGEPAARARKILAEQMQSLSDLGQINRILVDTKVGVAAGGTGHTFDWNEAGALFATATEMPMIVAGGLSPDNLGEAVERLNPWGLDVASGVEQVAGRKDPERLRLFLEKARAARPSSTPQ